MILQNLPTIFNSYPDWIIKWDEEIGYHPAENDEFLQLVLELHKYNYLIWHEEDIARREYVNSENIASVKRNIDKYNQRRNDAIEKVDEWLMINHFGYLADMDLPMRTETPGSVFDRLSILALKVFHMKEQTERADVEPSHVAACNHKLLILIQQRQDLQHSLSGMLADLKSERIRMKIYRQFKMYNDPSLNPQLYKTTP